MSAEFVACLLTAQNVWFIAFVNNNLVIVTIIIVSMLSSFQTVMLGKTLESPLDNKEIKPVNPKRNQPWIFTGRTDAEIPILWPPDVKNWFAGKDWRQEEKGMAEDEMIRWHDSLNGHESEQTLGDSEGQGRLSCCSPAAHVAESCTWFSDWTAAMTTKFSPSLYYLRKANVIKI